MSYGVLELYCNVLESVDQRKIRECKDEQKEYFETVYSIIDCMYFYLRLYDVAGYSPQY